MTPTITGTAIACFHCGENCPEDSVRFGDYTFCCKGCKTVFQLLNRNGLCAYYDLNPSPGSNQRLPGRPDKFAFLDDNLIKQKLVSFADEKQTNISLYLPQIHCSSCLYLLENLHSLHRGIVSARVDFVKKEIDIVFDPHQISLRALVELLTQTGYEPYLSLNDLNQKPLSHNKGLIYKLGVAGFCFANIMLLSFPEYLGLVDSEIQLHRFFRYLSFALAIPVFFFSARPFFDSGWKALKKGFLNIDAPIALAIIVTYIRSVYEVLTASGAGYFDSMSGIVFFMLAGRVLQERNFRQLSFDRNFTAYFPIAVTVTKDGKDIPCTLPDIKVGDTLVLHNQELIPADGILTKGNALINYSFVTGEAISVQKQVGEIVYAGGKQTGSAIEILVIKEVSQSYLTRLWSRDELREARKAPVSFVHTLSRYFTIIVFGIAAVAGIYWAYHDPSKILNVITAVLIVACPCALLLSNTFTNGNILRILAKNKLYLRDSQVIEDIARTSHIVFDKTGTLTDPEKSKTRYSGKPLTVAQEAAVIALTGGSNHPLSKAVNSYFGKKTLLTIQMFQEMSGQGIQGWADGKFYALGSEEYITGKKSKSKNTEVYFSVQGAVHGVFQLTNNFRPEIQRLVRSLDKNYDLSVISGDIPTDEKPLRKLFGQDSVILFQQSPEDKLEYIKSLQAKGSRAMMIGDGLNDAGALKQSTVGIAITNNANNFTPASDGIIDAKVLPELHALIRLCQANKIIVKSSFILSVMYNLAGLYLAVQGSLSPVIAAVLMPASSFTIVIMSFMSSNMVAKKLHLKQ